DPGNERSRWLTPRRAGLALLVFTGAWFQFLAWDDAGTPSTASGATASGSTARSSGFPPTGASGAWSPPTPPVAPSAAPTAAATEAGQPTEPAVAALTRAPIAAPRITTTRPRRTTAVAPALPA